MIYVEFNGAEQAERISLFSQDGREIKEYSVETRDSKIAIQIPGAQTGLLLMRIMLNDGRVVSRKIMVL
jgi:hypothetical protein